MIPPSCLSDKEAFLDLVIEKLAHSPIDFLEKAPGHGDAPGVSPVRRTAGVLLLLNFNEKEPYSRSPHGDFHFLLIKRSSTVAQPGDLSCPGGMLSPVWDSLLDKLVRGGCFPNLKGRGLAYAAARDKEIYRLITLYLTNAMREAWEEIRLSPFNLRFLGPLSTYDLLLFKRTIFPLVGFTKHPWRVNTNHEVEQIIEIPLRSFFDQANFGRYIIGFRDPQQSADLRYGEFPCLICRDSQDHEQILWGATFYIIINFLKTVCGYELDPSRSQRIIRRHLPDNYAQGQRS